MICRRSNNKILFLTEASCRAAIRLEEKVGWVVPYWCRHCQHYHMTSKQKTVKAYMKRRAA